jgi:2'-5' RNA ligase
MRPGDRLFCCFIDPHAEGEVFKEWPLHITLIPWFRTGVSSSELCQETQTLMAGIGPFDAITGGEAGFGRGGTKLVNLIELPSPLQDIEIALWRMLKSHDTWIVDETVKFERTFRPHVTVQKNSRRVKGDIVRCDSLYIIEQKGDYKEIVSRIHL